MTDPFQTTVVPEAMSAPPPAGERPAPRPEVSVVIAAFDEEATVGRVVRGVLEALGPTPGEVLVIDDGSIDRTGAEARSAGAAVIRNEARSGKGVALRRGLAAARGIWVALLDADGQDDPADLPRRLDAARAGADFVNGSRFLGILEEGSISPVNRVGNLAFTALVNLLFGARITDSQAGFRVIRADLARGLARRASEFEIETEMLLRAIRSGLEIREVPVTRHPRGNGKSRFRRVRNGTRILFWIVRERLSG